jgi:hypothetical protein
MALLIQESFEGFVSEARKRALGAVVVAWQQEWAQMPADAALPFRVAYDRIMRSTVLAYADGTVLRWEVEGPAAERSSLRARLEAAGFTVTERTRNIT